MSGRNSSKRWVSPARGVLVTLLVLGGCAGAAPPDPPPRPAARAEAPVVISVVGTNDLHGRIANLPVLGGYVGNLRRARGERGGVLLVDAGDMFQGTLESNLGEGAAVVSAYEAAGYAAVAVGNHEFDFGPAGPAVTPQGPSDDPRGALKARAASASFPFLCANLNAASRGRVEWPNMPARVMVRVAGVSVGIVGVTTEETLVTTLHANVADLAIAPIASTLAREAASLRAEGARVVVALAHAGGRCARFGGDPTADGCEPESEIFRVARALPPGSVDVIVAGHSHAAVAHTVNGVAIVESYSYGRAFGRVDLTLTGDPPVIGDVVVHAPQDLCPGGDAVPCAPGSYEGGPVVPDARIAEAIAPHLDRARQKRAEPLGVRLGGPLRRAYAAESALGNLFADLIRASRPGAAVGLMNGGGLRADLPAGVLTYGALFEAFPFDNKVATVRLLARELRGVLARHLAGERGGLLSVSGVRVVATCAGPELMVQLTREDGAAIRDEQELEVVASDFMLTGGDQFWGGEPPGSVHIGDALIRDEMARLLGTRATIEEGEIFSAARPRMVLPGPRPVRCPR